MVTAFLARPTWPPALRSAVGATDSEVGHPESRAWRHRCDRARGFQRISRNSGVRARAGPRRPNWNGPAARCPAPGGPGPPETRIGGGADLDHGWTVTTCSMVGSGSGGSRLRSRLRGRVSQRSQCEGPPTLLLPTDSESSCFHCTCDPHSRARPGHPGWASSEVRARRVAQSDHMTNQAKAQIGA